MTLKGLLALLKSRAKKNAVKMKDKISFKLTKYSPPSLFSQRKQGDKEEQKDEKENAHKSCK